MEQFHSRKGGGGDASGGGSSGHQDRGKRSMEGSGWSLEESKEEWRKVRKSDQSNPSGTWFNTGGASSSSSTSSRGDHGVNHSSLFQSTYNNSKYKQEDNQKIRSESMRDELTRNYIKPPPNRVVHCCSFPCLCRPDTNQLPQQSSKHHHQRDEPSGDRDGKSSNWFKLPSHDRHGSK